MKIIVVALLAFGLSVSVRVAQAENPTDFEVKSTVDDSTFQLSEQKGKFVVLHFLLKTECPYCLRYTQNYAAMAEKTPDVVHVFLKPDSEDEIKKWSGKLSKDGLNDLPKIYRDADAELARQFKVPNGYKFHGQNVHYPAIIVLDGEGKERFRYVGKSNSDRLSTEDFEAKIIALKNGTTR